MSWQVNGRVTHDYQEYLRWQQNAEATSARAAANALAQETARLQSELIEQQRRSEREVSEARKNAAEAGRQLAQSREEVRLVARAQTRLEQHQRSLESVQHRIQERQDEFEHQTEARQAELSQEINRVGADARQRVEAARREARAQADELKSQMQQERARVDGELRSVRTDITQTREELGRRISTVKSELNAECQRRIVAEQSRIGQAQAAVHATHTALRGLPNLDRVGLTVQRTQAELALTRAEELLRTSHPENALASADAAMISVHTAEVEYQRRVGVIQGVAEHLERVASAIERQLEEKALQQVFASEYKQLKAAVQRLRATASVWTSTLPWTIFEVQNEHIARTADTLLEVAVELRSATPGVLGQIKAREDRVKALSKALEENQFGGINQFEISFADPGDIKSPRHLRAHVGSARIDAYVELDGTFRLNGYGFDTSAECSQRFYSVTRVLEERGSGISQAAIDPSNPQSAPPVAVATSDRLRALQASVGEHAAALEKGK